MRVLQNRREDFEQSLVACVSGNIHWCEILLVTQGEREDGLRESDKMPCQQNEVVVSS